MRDEIVVVDSGSSDRTREIAAEPRRARGAGTLARLCRTEELRGVHRANDWILSIDADEELTPALAAEISALQNTAMAFDGWTMPRLARYLGRWIRHSGWYPDRKVRLYHRERASWQGEYVHESVQVTGRTGHLQNDLLHYTCDSLAQHLRTLDRYTTLAAQASRRSGKPRSVPSPRRRSALDLSCVRTSSSAAFMDGAHGLIIAAMASFYTFMKYAKAREMIAANENPASR